MYFLYIDDSGSVANQSENFFVLGGVVIPEEKHYWVNKHLDELASTHSATNPLDVEFHACDIFSGRKEPWSGKRDKKERQNTIKAVLDVASREHLPTIACALEKSHYPIESIVQRTFEDVISRFQSYLDQEHKNTGKNTRGMIVFDKSAYENDIQQLALKFRGEGTRYRQISAIQEVPLFVDSRASRAIQLADHVAYAVFRRYNANDLEYFNKIQTLFGAHGLCHSTRKPEECTCPSCIRRQSD